MCVLAAEHRKSSTSNAVDEEIKRFITKWLQKRECHKRRMRGAPMQCDADAMSLVQKIYGGLK